MVIAANFAFNQLTPQIDPKDYKVYKKEEVKKNLKVEPTPPKNKTNQPKDERGKWKYYIEEANVHLSRIKDEGDKNNYIQQFIKHKKRNG